MSPQTASSPTALTLNAFTRSGYTFSDWNTVAGGGGTAYADGATYAFNANVTLYAQWILNPIFVQAGDTNTFPASGVSGNILPANCTIGNAVAAFIEAGALGQTISTVVSTIGTFTKVVAAVSPAGIDGEWWVCDSALVAGRAITVVTSGAGTWGAQGTEWSNVTAAASGGSNSTTGANATLTVAPGVTGNAVLVGTAVDSTHFTAGPAAPWTDYNAGFFTLAFGEDVAWQVAPSTTSLTATWTNTSQGYVTVGLILS